MAANTLASIAAATAAGWKLERYVLPAGQFVTKLGRKLTGIEGQVGRYAEFPGESAVSSAAADTASLANLNAFRNNRYGIDSAAVSTSQTPVAATSPNTQGVVPTHGALTKDKN